MSTGWRNAQRARPSTANARGTAIDSRGNFTRLSSDRSHACETGEPGASRFPHVQLRASHMVDWRRDPI
jgi:hypothetical protein